MAVTACYAGPFFNMCIGVGVSFLTATIAEPSGTIRYVKAPDGTCQSRCALGDLPFERSTCLGSS